MVEWDGDLSTDVHPLKLLVRVGVGNWKGLNLPCITIRLLVND